MRYLPLDQGHSSAWDVHTSAPVRITYSRSCTHPGEPVSYDMQDRRANGMPKWYGTCCAACGRLLTRVPLV
jgi:hypothetical protein